MKFVQQQEKCSLAKKKETRELGKNVTPLITALSRLIHFELFSSLPLIKTPRLFGTEE